MVENKQKILDLLLPALRETRNLYDVVELAKFASGHFKIINVAMDSGTAMIVDVIQQLV